MCCELTIICVTGNTLPPTLLRPDSQRQCETEIYNSFQNHHVFTQLLRPDGIS